MFSNREKGMIRKRMLAYITFLLAEMGPLGYRQKVVEI